MDWKEISDILNGSIRTGRLASRVLVDSTKIENMPDIFHDLCTDKILSKSWSTRENAAYALKCLCKRYNDYLHQVFCQAKSDCVLFAFEELDIGYILKYGEKLYSNSSIMLDNKEMYTSSWLERQKKALRSRLGKEATSVDASIASRYDNIDTDLVLNDFEYHAKRSTYVSDNIDSENKNKSIADELCDGSKVIPVLSHLSDDCETWLGRLARFMIIGLLDARWETRHGCCLGLKSLIQGISQFSNESCSKNKFERDVHNVYVENHYNAQLPSFIAEDIVSSCFCVLMLDRFVDLTTSTVSFAPVKESCAQLLAFAARSQYPGELEKVFRKCMLMANNSDHWTVSYGGILALRYIIPMLAMSCLRHELDSIISITIKGLLSTIDDVVCVSAQLLHSLQLAITLKQCPDEFQNSDCSVNSLALDSFRHVPQIRLALLKASQSVCESSSSPPDLIHAVASVAKIVLAVVNCYPKDHHGLHHSSSGDLSSLLFEAINNCLELTAELIRVYPRIAATCSMRRKFRSGIDTVLLTVSQCLSSLHSGELKTTSVSMSMSVSVSDDSTSRITEKAVEILCLILRFVMFGSTSSSRRPQSAVLVTKDEHTMRPGNEDISENTTPLLSLSQQHDLNFEEFISAIKCVNVSCVHHGGVGLECPRPPAPATAFQSTLAQGIFSEVVVEVVRWISGLAADKTNLQSVCETSKPVKRRKTEAKPASDNPLQVVQSHVIGKVKSTCQTTLRENTIDSIYTGQDGCNLDSFYKLLALLMAAAAESCKDLDEFEAYETLSTTLCCPLKNMGTELVKRQRSSVTSRQVQGGRVPLFVFVVDGQQLPLERNIIDSNPSKERADSEDVSRNVDAFLKCCAVLVATMRRNLSMPSELFQGMLTSFCESISVCTNGVIRERHQLHILSAVCNGDVGALFHCLFNQSTSMPSDAVVMRSVWPYLHNLVADILVCEILHDRDISKEVKISNSIMLPRTLLDMLSGNNGVAAIEAGKAVVTSIAHSLQSAMFSTVIPLDLMLRKCCGDPFSVPPLTCSRLLSACIKGLDERGLVALAELGAANDATICDAVTNISIDALSTIGVGDEGLLLDTTKILLTLMNQSGMLCTSTEDYLLSTSDARSSLYKRSIARIIQTIQEELGEVNIVVSPESNVRRHVSARLLRVLCEHLGVALLHASVYVECLATALRGISAAYAPLRSESSATLKTLISLATLARRTTSFTMDAVVNSNMSSSTSKSSSRMTSALFRTLLSETPSLLGDDPHDSALLQTLFEKTALRKMTAACKDSVCGSSEVLQSNFTFLRPYQWEGVSWLTSLRRCGFGGALLADEMGLGKTVQTLTAIAVMALEAKEESGQFPRCLVVCPSSLISHWEYEVNKYFPNGVLSATKYISGKTIPRHNSQSISRIIVTVKENEEDNDDVPFDSSNARFNNNVDCEVVLVSYSQLRSRSAALMKTHWRIAVLDECHSAANPTSQLSTVVSNLSASFRIGLSGTPIQNQVKDLWSVMRFLMPDYLGDYHTFRRNFILPIQNAFREKCKLKESGADKSSRKRFSALEITAEGLDRLRALHQQVLPFILRRSKDAVLQDLPPKTVVDILCPLTTIQRSMYASLQQGLCLSDEALEVELRTLLETKKFASRTNSVTNPLQALLYLMLLSVHPALVTSSVHDAYRRRLFGDLHCSGKMIGLGKLLLECGVIRRFECTDTAWEQLYMEEQGVVSACDADAHTLSEDESSSSDSSSPSEKSDDEDQDQDQCVEEVCRASGAQGGKAASVGRAVVNKTTVKVKEKIVPTPQPVVGTRRSTRLADLSAKQYTVGGVGKHHRNPVAVDSNLEAMTHTAADDNVLHKCLIFAQHRAALDVVESCVMQRYFPNIRYSRLDGSVSPLLRAAVVREFNGEDEDEDDGEKKTAPPIRLLLLTTASCGLGLNLTAADVVVFLEHSWNPFQDLQAADRAHRIGQKKPVTVYRLLAESTVEERIMGLQGRKVTTASEIINDNNATLMASETAEVPAGQRVSFGRVVMHSLRNTVTSASASAEGSDHDHGHDDMQSGMDWMEHEAISIEAFLSSFDADL